MPRTNIWQDGVNTRFSRDNQPANRGRKKGTPNRLTIMRTIFKMIDEANRLIDQERRERRNARRRERYRAKATAKKLSLIS